jgi:hypothetical protein
MTDPMNGELAEALERLERLLGGPIALRLKLHYPNLNVLAADLRTLLAASRLRSGMTREGEAIVAAAHLYRDAHKEGDTRAVPVIVSAPPPARHHNLFIAYDRLGAPDESGFLTSTGRFVGRAEALRIAKAAGQPLIDHPSRHETLLFSEDLW